MEISDAKFKVGDKVFYTNSNGVKWGIKTITEVVEWHGENRYHYEGSDSPWYPVAEQCLKLAEITMECKPKKNKELCGFCGQDDRVSHTKCLQILSTPQS